MRTLLWSMTTTPTGPTWVADVRTGCLRRAVPQCIRRRHVVAHRIRGRAGTDTHSVGLLLAVATLGNVLGSAVNWLLGPCIERYRDRPWFPIKPDSLGRAQG